ncbi:MAG: hypothetical protein KC418_19895 [Anaerolineales bacterium]|nr:hypothetical protein [Anaerolineales bacterium]MCB8953180.1 hypothetical protein [Ardenticatenales bacterium]
MAKRKSRPARRGTQIGLVSVSAGILLITAILLLFTEYESYTSLYDADYIGSAACGDCHPFIYANWQESPHANMTRRPTPESVVGDFDNGSWTLPVSAQVLPTDSEPAVRTYTEGGDYYMALRDPQTNEFVPFKIAYVIGYQYRQTYLTQETGGVLRRLPLQWSTETQDFFPYWNVQEGSTPSVADLWAQMTSLNSAWNLFCARCHTTDLHIVNKNTSHTLAETHWVDNGIGCEACHGPGSHHANYFENNYVNRLVAYLNSRVRQEPVAYIVNPQKVDKGEAMSVCARCHGPDIAMSLTDLYRIYEPGYSREGRINDLSAYFKSQPLEPGRTAPTVEVWADGRPKGVGMIFRSFIESVCYDEATTRCFHCHDPHNNKQPRVPNILEPSEASNRYCLNCHGDLVDQVAQHTHHTPGESGSFCYDCHMPNDIFKLVTGVPQFARSHTMSHIPNPQNTILYGPDGAPNACNECHNDQTPVWAQEWMDAWWGAATTEG